MLLELFFLFLLGIVFGSFVTSISWRIPKNLAFVKERSICPKCKKQIKWFDNIPLFSYILLQGRCRKCKSKISFRYPIIEFSSGLGFVLVYYLLDLQGTYSVFQLVLALAIFVVLLTIFVIDLENQIIPDSLVFIGIAFIYCYLLISNAFLIEHLFSGFLAASFLMLVHLFTGGRGMGLGDVKFAVLGGMIVGFRLLPIWLLLSFVTGGIVGIILLIVKKAKLKTKIAFGPFLILGIGLALLFGDNIMYLLGLA